MIPEAREVDAPLDREPVFSARDLPEDRGLDQALRPRDFGEFVGQSRLIGNLTVYMQAARERGEPLDHILLSGLPGLGKTTLSHLIAHEMGTELRSSSGPALSRPRDLAGILTNLGAGDILFIDEIHRLPITVEEYLYSAMEDFSLDIILDQGPAARSLRIDLKRFTLVGATTREGQLSAPLRSRFGVNERLDFYPPEDLQRIILASAARLGVEIDGEAAAFLAAHARGTPRVANRVLKRVRDFAQVQSDNRIDRAVAEHGLDRLGIDGHGLSEVDRRILRTLVRAGGQAVGLKTLSVSVGEEEQTIEDVYEPYLIQQGFLLKTPRGRLATPRAEEVVGGEDPRSGPGDLFSSR